MVEAFLADAFALSTHLFGHFFMLHVLEYCSPDVVSCIVHILDDDLAAMAADGPAGAVIGKALSKSTKEGCHSLVTNLLKDPERLTIMACSRWGHDAVKQALQMADSSTCHEACAELLKRSARLRSSRYGRSLPNFAAEQQSSHAFGRQQSSPDVGTN